MDFLYLFIRVIKTEGNIRDSDPSAGTPVRLLRLK